MTNEKNRGKTDPGKYPLWGLLLGLLDRISSASGKAVLDEKLIQPNSPNSAEGATFLEATFGGIFLLFRLYVLLPWRRKRKNNTPAGNTTTKSARARILALLTFITIGTDKALFVVALISIDFGIAGGIYYATPLAVPILWGFRSGSRSRAAGLTVFAVAVVAGVGLLVQQNGPTQGSHYLLGVVCAVGAGTARTLFLPVTDRLIREQGRSYTEKAIAWSMLSVGLVIGGLVAITGDLASFLNWPIIGWAMLVGLLNNTLPRVIQMPAREHAGDAAYAVFLAASPVLATLVGFTFLGERPSLVQWAGLGLIVVSAAAVANMSLEHGPLIERSPATPRDIYEDALQAYRGATAQHEALTSLVEELKARLIEAEIAAAQADLDEATAEAGEADRRWQSAGDEVTAAEARVAAAQEWLGRAQTEAKEPTSTF
jgi:drug/metabolite transporter (DMT)-like permease